MEDIYRQIQVRRESLIRDPKLVGSPKSVALMELAKGANRTAGEKVLKTP
jgi:hypothetical protein